MTVLWYSSMGSVPDPLMNESFIFLLQFTYLGFITSTPDVDSASLGLETSKTGK
jgi:hypothetical protein